MKGIILGHYDILQRLLIPKGKGKGNGKGKAKGMGKGKAKGKGTRISYSDCLYPPLPP